MKSLMLVLAGSLTFAPLAFAQNHAVPRGGGDGGGSSGGGSHPGVSSSSGGSSGGGYSGGYSGGSSSSSSGGSAPSTAERRHPRAGTGTGGYYGGGYYPGYPGYPGGYYPPAWYGSYWWPYGAYGWYGGYWGSPWAWGYGGYGGGTVYHYVQQETGSVRVLVDPSEARVYVDGYYAGTVDDYDGLFQRLNVSPGRHEVMLKLEGYKTHRMRVYVPAEGTLKLHYEMQKGSGETFEDLAANVPENELRRERERRDEERSIESGRPADPMSAGGGQLKLTVRPADASVYVDGAFRGSGREAAQLSLPPGRHRIEVVRPGFRTIERDVEITPGDATDLTIELDKSSI